MYPGIDIPAMLIAAQTSPAVTHSVDVAHSWTGPTIGSVGHGVAAAWQAADVRPVAQQISPVEHPLALIHAAVAAASVPPLLLPAPEDEEVLPPPSPVFVAGDDELLQPDASAKPRDPAARVEMRRTLELCIGRHSSGMRLGKTPPLHRRRGG
jgi:hypothetical protein